jgi:mono/diheme cytochrome c family protein
LTSRQAGTRRCGFRVWLSAVTICMFFAPVRDAAAQSHSRPRANSKTTKSGVYTAEQAARGRDVYLGNCKSCHTPESHTGATFNATWNKRSLVELYGFLRERMPKNEPGSLSAQEYADVLAYLLRMNRMPSGRSELPADSAAMKKIRIETTKSP